MSAISEYRFVRRRRCRRCALAASLSVLGCAAPSSGDAEGDGVLSSESSSSTETEQGEATSALGESAAQEDTIGEEPCLEAIPEGCVMPTPGETQLVSAQGAGPFILRYPTVADSGTDIILFHPGGAGDQQSAVYTYQNWLEQGEGIDSFIVAVPFATDGNFTDEYDRSLLLLDELQTCYCNSGRVHLGGTSNGGLSAFVLMLAAPERFATLLGAPGAWQNFDEQAIADALESKSLFLGVGALDAGWLDGVKLTHEVLASEYGVDSTYMEFEGQGHLLTPQFDESVFFDFWASH